MELEAYGLAMVGAVEGVYKYIIKPELTAKRAWTTLALGITAYELLCPPGETLSEGVDKALESHKVVTAALIGITALHLCNVLPIQIDPFSQIMKHIK